MAKSLSERIAERAQRKKPSRNAENLAAFLAVKTDVKQALEDGWPVKSVWETLHEEGKIAVSYQAFRGYVNRLLLAPKSREPEAPAPAAPPASPSQAPDKKDAPAPSPETKLKPAPMPGFSFQAKPDKKDLL